MWLIAMLMFAGKTATSKSTIPIAAARRSRGHGASSPTPPASSATPLKYTSRRGDGNDAGTMATYVAVIAKCPIPDAIMNATIAHRATRLNPRSSRITLFDA